MRIALIHALKHSILPIEDAFARLWPAATLANLLDDSLSADLAREGCLTPAMTERFLTLARYARFTGADGVLFTCSAFGPCIEACARELHPIPVLKPNEAMIEEAVAMTRDPLTSVQGAHAGASPDRSVHRGGEFAWADPALAGHAARVGLVATFAPTLNTMPAEFAALAPATTIVPCLAADALAALDRGDLHGHDQAAARAAGALRDVDVVALAQFSLARAAPMIEAATGKPVLTTPDSAVRKLQRLLDGGAQ